MDREKELQHLAFRIKSIRLNQGLSQEELANKCNFDRTYISMLERAKRNPSYLNLLKLADGLEISLLDILGEKDDF